MPLASPLRGIALVRRTNRTRAALVNRAVGPGPTLDTGLDTGTVMERAAGMVPEMAMGPAVEMARVAATAAPPMAMTMEMEESTKTTRGSGGCNPTSA